MYKLSIIIPIYNVKKYIQECLESVLCQLPSNVQIICVNDGSPDNSMQIAKNLISKYSTKTQDQFLFITQENQGLSAARNTGLEHATGEYVGFLDSDDKFSPDYFSRILPTLVNNDYDIIDFNIITPKGHVIRTRGETFDSVFNRSKWFCPARVFKTNLFDNMRFTVGISYEDVDLTPQLYLSANSTFHLDAPLYWYRVNENSITKSFSHQNNIKTVDSLDFICNKYLDLYFQNNNPYYAMVAIHCYYLLCISAYRRFNLRKSLKYIKKHHKRMKNILIDKLPIEYDVIDKKVLALYHYPIAYCSTYIIYDHLRSASNRNNFFNKVS